MSFLWNQWFLLWIGRENGTALLLINTGAFRSLARRHAFIINLHLTKSLHENAQCHSYFMPSRYSTLNHKMSNLWLFLCIDISPQASPILCWVTEEKKPITFLMKMSNYRLLFSSRERISESEIVASLEFVKKGESSVLCSTYAERKMVKVANFGWRNWNVPEQSGPWNLY